MTAISYQEAPEVLLVITTYKHVPSAELCFKHLKANMVNLKFHIYKLRPLIFRFFAIRNIKAKQVLYDS